MSMISVTTTSEQAIVPGRGANGAVPVPAVVDRVAPDAALADATTTGAAALDPDRRAPGRPRSVKADEAIIEAVLDLLSEGSTVEALSIEAVANRAGVGKATIYRRWPNKEVLVVDAVAALKGPLPEIAGESIRDDLLTLLRPIGSPNNTRAGRIIPCLVPELRRNLDLAQCYRKLVEPRRNRMRDVLRRGMVIGELRADLDVEVTITLLVAPMMAQSMLQWNPGLDMSMLPQQVVDGVMPGILATRG